MNRLGRFVISYTIILIVTFPLVSPKSFAQGLTAYSVQLAQSATNTFKSAEITQPRTQAGANAAARAYYRRQNRGTCVRNNPNNQTANRGLARISVFDCSDSVSGAGELWGYDGRKWKPLSVPTQQADFYINKLPGKLRLCKSASATIYSRPTKHSTIIKKLLSDLTVVAYEFRLTKSRPETFYSDGIGWYRVNFSGRSGWIVAGQTIEPQVSEGCQNFASQYWTNRGVHGYNGFGN